MPAAQATILVDGNGNGNGDGNGKCGSDEADNSLVERKGDELHPDSSDEAPGEPVVKKTGLVSEWEKPGDLDENEIESGLIDEQNWSTFQFDNHVHDVELEFTYQ
ncbi:hypothetical protein [Natrinema sp. H-ect4]|uniref:hypothetical protein n=1 Tax=Natrinema sp. H-ect4 TaxID=3242699 RepID=UPI0035A8DDF6